MPDTARAPCVAILTAMPSELHPVRRALALDKSLVGDRTVYRGRVAGNDVIATHTGVGPARARATTEWVLGAAAVDHVIVVGVAGGVGPSLPIGHLLAPATVIDRASGRELHPVATAGRVLDGRLLTSDVLAEGAAATTELGAYDVVAVDMETAAIGAVCESDGCPWSAFRAISDRVGDADGAILGLLGPDGEANPRAVATFIVTRPWRIPQLVRLGRGARSATAAGAAAALEACTTHAFVARGPG